MTEVSDAGLTRGAEAAMLATRAAPAAGTSRGMRASRSGGRRVHAAGMRAHLRQYVFLHCMAAPVGPLRHSHLHTGPWQSWQLVSSRPSLCSGGGAAGKGARRGRCDLNSRTRQQSRGAGGEKPSDKRLYVCSFIAAERRAAGLQRRHTPQVQSWSVQHPAAASAHTAQACQASSSWWAVPPRPTAAPPLLGLLPPPLPLLVPA